MLLAFQSTRNRCGAFRYVVPRPVDVDVMMLVRVWAWRFPPVTPKTAYGVVVPRVEPKPMFWLFSARKVATNSSDRPALKVAVVLTRLPFSTSDPRPTVVVPP